MTRWVWATVVALGLALLAPAAASASEGSALRVEGTVAAPATYSMGSLSALATATVQVVERDRRRHGQAHTERAVALETLVDLAQPVLPQAKNALLRVTITVRARETEPVTFALGELDPGFGNHPAFLSVAEDGAALRSPKLVVPGDSTDERFLSRADQIVVGIASPTPTTPATAGAIDVVHGGRDRSLGPALLASLPARTVQVAFLAGGGAQRHTETGPTLSTVLVTARARSERDTWVAAVGSDGYVAVVTPAEAVVGGRPLLLSLQEDGAALPQPRLVPDGDVKGGRYVFQVVTLVVGEGADGE